MTSDPKSIGLGFQYQYVVGLLKLLQDSNPDAKVFFEKDEDIDIGNDKYQVKRRKTNLSDSYGDFWKFVEEWRIKLKNSKFPKNTNLYFLTTQNITGNLVKCFYNKNRFEEFMVKIKEVANSLKEGKTKSIMNSFLQENIENQKILFNSINIQSECDFEGISENIKSQYIFSEKEKSFDKLIGWWERQVIANLKGEKESISKREIQQELSDINKDYHKDNIPFESEDLNIDKKISEEYNEHLFVKELRSIDLTEKSIENAKNNYYKNFNDRSNWISNSYISLDNLKDYDFRLIENWENQSETNNSDKSNYLELMKEVNEIKRGVPTPQYISRGSYLLLSDIPYICWNNNSRENLINKENYIYPIEAIRMLNPDFLSKIILIFSINYFERNKESPEIIFNDYFIPIVVNSKIRESLKDGISNFQIFLNENPFVKQKIKNLSLQYKPFVARAIIYGIKNNLFSIDSLKIVHMKKINIENSNQEIAHIFKKTAQLGRLFSKYGLRSIASKLNIK